MGLESLFIKRKTLVESWNWLFETELAMPNVTT